MILWTYAGHSTCWGSTKRLPCLRVCPNQLLLTDQGVLSPIRSNKLHNQSRQTIQPTNLLFCSLCIPSTDNSLSSTKRAILRILIRTALKRSFASLHLFQNSWFRSLEGRNYRTRLRGVSSTLDKLIIS